MSRPVISSRNIIPRFRDAFNKLAKCHEDLVDFRATFTDDEWLRFVNFAAGFITSSLWKSEELLDAEANRDETG